MCGKTVKLKPQKLQRFNSIRLNTIGIEFLNFPFSTVVMKTVFLSFLLLLSVLFFSNAQPQILWQKTLGGSSVEESSRALQTADGGFIICGTTESVNGQISFNHGHSDFWVVKTDSNGILEWEKCYGGLLEDQASSISQSNDNGFIICGSSSSNDSLVSGNHGNADYWIVKTDSTGNMEWQKSYGGDSDESAVRIINIVHGGYAIAGNTFSNNGDITGFHGYCDIWIVVIDSVGNIIWQKTYGGSDAELAFSIIGTFDGGFAVAGLTSSNDGDVTGLHAGQDVWIFKTDSAGNLEWQSALGGSGSENAQSIIQNPDSTYTFIAMTGSVDGDVLNNQSANGVWLVHLNASGNILWQQCYGGNQIDYAFDLKSTNDAGYIIGGESSSNDTNVTGNHGAMDVWHIETDSIGNLQWENCYGGSLNESCNTIIQTNDGGYFFSGGALSNNGDVSGNHGLIDYWIARLGSLNVSVDNDANLHEPVIVYPNPFSTSTLISFEIESEQKYYAMILDACGRTIKTFYNQLKSSGNQQLLWNGKDDEGKDVCNGVYYCRITAGEKVYQKRLVFVK
jgi:hypothetical protein